MENKEDIIDFGSVNVPDSWDKLTLKKYQDIERYYDDKDTKFNAIDVLDILIDKDRDWIMSLPTEFLDIILEKLSFLSTGLPDVQPSSSLKIGGEEYSIQFQNKLRTGEYVAVDAVLKDDKHNYAAFLAILCRKKDEAYDSKFENEVLEDRIKLFESQPVISILPLLGFFINCYMISENLSRLSSKVVEGLNLIATRIKTSPKLGVGKRQYMKWQIMKLRRSLKSTKCI